MKRSPLDFYHQFMWKFKNETRQKVESWYGCTRCGQLLQSYDQVVEHCQKQGCKDKKNINWLEQMQP